MVLYRNRTDHLQSPVETANIARQATACAAKNTVDIAQGAILKLAGLDGFAALFLVSTVLFNAYSHGMANTHEFRLAIGTMRLLAWRVLEGIVVHSLK